MMYDIQALKERADLREIVQEAGIKLRHNRACCPFHEEKTASFFVHPNGKYFKCFGCGVGGDAILFVQKYYGIDFKASVSFLNEKYNIGKLTPLQSAKINTEREIKAKFDEWKRNTVLQLIDLFREMYFCITADKPELSIEDATAKYIYAVNHIDLIDLYLRQIDENAEGFYKNKGEKEVISIAGKWNSFC